jgi:MFS family permease
MTEEQASQHQAPFIPSDAAEPPLPEAPWRVFGSRAFFRLWLAQCVSSLGDWIGLIAILAIAARVSDNSGAAVSLVMTTRVLPGFLLGTVGGVIIDRFDRRTVMVLCDIGRASLLVLLPFVESLPGLLMISLGLEVLTLMWGPAQAASVPNLVPDDQLASANSLSLAASYGTFPIASIIFSLLAGLATLLGNLGIISAFKVDQEALALVFDAITFLVSAAIVYRLPLPRRDRSGQGRIDWTETFREIKEGLQFVSQHALVRGVMLGLGFGLIGAGAMIPLGPSFAQEVLNGGSAAFGVLMTALGFGAAAGVITLLWLQGRLPRIAVFCFAVIGTGGFLVLAASVSALAPAALLIGCVGACAGTTYVTGFTVLQESVSDELRGRTFATLYTVVRLCLLISLTISPLWADFWDWVTQRLLVDQAVQIGPYTYALPGVRIALWGGGIITFVAGMVAWRSIRRAERVASLTGGGPDLDHGPEAPLVALGLLEPARAPELDTEVEPEVEPEPEVETEPVPEPVPEVETEPEPEPEPEAHSPEEASTEGAAPAPREPETPEPKAGA